MYEVTESNFDEYYPRICEHLRKAKFVSIDSEFSGIKTAEDAKVSLFDTVEERYVHQKNSIQGCIAIQFGITAFQYEPDTNKYRAQGYNFYLFPRVVPGRDQLIEWQASSVEFLCAYGFDFNKFAREGISYLTDDEERQLERKLASGSILSSTDRAMSYKDEDELKASYNQVYEWSKNADVGDSMLVNALTPMLRYMVQKELRSRVSNVWTEAQNGKVIVQKIDNDVRKILEEKEKDEEKLERDLINSCVGFSKLFKFLVELKIPIVGHNMMLDLLFMHQQFYKPLPNKYERFKNDIHQLFPTICDTKHLSFELKRLITKRATWKSNGLSDLYEYFSKGPGHFGFLNSPAIELMGEPEKHTVNFHQAGWDSYCAGYCFAKMAHAFAVARYGGSAELRSLTCTEMLSAATKHANRINLIRASVNHANLAGPDPPCVRPQWLHVRSLGSNQFNITQIAEMFAPYGTVDVKPFYTRRQVLVAVTNHASARDILTRFRTNRDIRVAPYSLLRHSPAVQILLWSSVVIFGGTAAWMLHRNINDVATKS